MGNHVQEQVNRQPVNRAVNPAETGRLGIVVGIVLAGIVVSILLYGTLHWEEQRLIKEEFKLRSADRMKSITSEFESGLTLVRSVAACMQSPTEMTPARFRALTKHLLSESSALHAVSWNSRVAAGDLRDHIAAAKVRFPAYEVRQLRPDGTIEIVDARTLQVSDSRDFVVVDLIEPFEPNQSALGFDIASEPVRREALKRACDEGEPIASGRIRLVQETGAHFGTLVVCPIYREEIATDSANSRQTNDVAGVVVGVYQIGDTVEAALKNLEPTGIDVHLFDELASPGEQLLYAHSSRLRPQPMEIIEDPETLAAYDYCESSTIDFAGRRWSLYCTPTASYLASRKTWLPVSVLGGGLFITLLIAGYVSNLSQLTSQLRRQIVERAEAEQQVRESEQRFRSFCEKLPVGVFLNDQDGNHIYANDLCLELTGLTSAAALESGWVQAIHTQDRERVSAGFRRAIEGGEDFEMEARLQVAGKTRWIHTHVVPRRNTQGEVIGCMGSLMDITGRLAAEKRLREHQRSLAHVSRLSTMGEMVAGIAHEINQPLAAISNYATACINVFKSFDHDSDTPIEKWLQQISSQAVRCGDIIRRMRSFTNNGDQAWDYVDLNRIVHDSVALIGSDMRHQAAEINCHLPHLGPQVYASEVQLQQVLVNLLRNAYDATHEEPAPKISIRVDVCDHRVRLTVEDNGPGIEEQQHEKLFDAFFTTRQDGMGMGLAISKSIIEAHQGNLRLDPETTVGAKFLIELPLPQRVKVHDS